MNRYIRNLQLEGFNSDSQDRLQSATVAIVGCGALGSVVAMYLAAAGVGCLRIADFDNIDLTNLQRQVFFTEAEVGRPKVNILAEKINALNSDISVELYPKLLTSATVADFISDCSVIAECSDNPATKALVVNAGQQSGVPVVVGGVKDYSGQLSVFTSPRVAYTDIFPSPLCSAVLPCGVSGVFSPVPGIVASLQTSEILKLIALLPGSLHDQLLTFDVRTMNFQKFSF